MGIKLSDLQSLSKLTLHSTPYAKKKYHKSAVAKAATPW